MKLIIVSPSEYTPALHLDPHKKKIEISGISRPENVGLFYQQVLDWIDEFEDGMEGEEPGNIHVIFKLEYCNSATLKFLLMILERLANFQDKGYSLTIDWYYDDGDDKMLEDGEDIADAAEIDFNFYTM